MSTIRNLTCIVCPRGCQIEVRLADDGRIEDIKGFTCKRGYTYAQNECTHPQRTVTTTVRCEDGTVVPVKTADVIPKEKIFAVMEEINRTTAPSHLRIGDVVIENAASTGVPVICTANH